MLRPVMKHVCILTIVILLVYSFCPLLPLYRSLNTVSASGLEKEDVYKGLAFGVLLYVISRIGSSSEVQESDDFRMDNSDINSEDREILARIIHAESRGEPFEGQIAVGAVVLNRVKSDSFPNTIQEVIYQQDQFTPVADGQINLRPSETSYQAADEALNGNDPSLGALFFYNPTKARTLWWLSQREETVTIGNHVFAK